MYPSIIPTASSNLYCAEDNASIFEEFESDVTSEFSSNPQLITPEESDYRILSFGLLSPLERDEFLGELFNREIQHFPCTHYLNRFTTGELDSNARKKAIDWITKVHSHYNFGPLTSFLSINYMDRFLSAYELPKDNAWMMQLLAVACLSLAAKMEEIDVPLPLDFQIGNPRFVFEAKTIQGMELLVLSILEWRMQSVTPFSFLDYFLFKICGDQMPPMCFFSKAIQLITSITKVSSYTQIESNSRPLDRKFKEFSIESLEVVKAPITDVTYGIDFLEFKASEIAASVTILLAAVETKTIQDIHKAICLLSGRLKEEVVIKCVKMIQSSSSVTTIRSDYEINGGGSISSSVLEYPASLSSSANSKLDCSVLYLKKRKLYDTHL